MRTFYVLHSISTDFLNQGYNKTFVCLDVYISVVQIGVSAIPSQSQGHEYFNGSDPAQIILIERRSFLYCTLLGSVQVSHDTSATPDLHLTKCRQTSHLHVCQNALSM